MPSTHSEPLNHAQSPNCQAMNKIEQKPPFHSMQQLNRAILDDPTHLQSTQHMHTNRPCKRRTKPLIAITITTTHVHHKHSPYHRFLCQAMSKIQQRPPIQLTCNQRNTSTRKYKKKQRNE
eukprot:260255_1